MTPYSSSSTISFPVLSTGPPRHVLCSIFFSPLQDLVNYCHFCDNFNLSKWYHWLYSWKEVCKFGSFKQEPDSSSVFLYLSGLNFFFLRIWPFLIKKITVPYLELLLPLTFRLSLHSLSWNLTNNICHFIHIISGGHTMSICLHLWYYFHQGGNWFPHSVLTICLFT